MPIRFFSRTISISWGSIIFFFSSSTHRLQGGALAGHDIRSCDPCRGGITFSAGPQSHVGRCLLPYHASIRLHGARGEPQSHAPSSCRQKPNNPSRAGHKTTPPGRESPTENQTLGHAVLQMSWVVCFQMLSVFKCICYVRYYYACYLKFRFFCFICLTHTRNTYNSSESQYTHIQQIHSASRNDVSMTTWTTCTPNHLAVSQS